jgi:acetyltransferase-like isoleucine patch superfamily enzyme
VKRVLEKIVGALKNDPAYRMDDRYSFRQLLSITQHRMFQVLRGAFLKIRINSSGIVFCGKRVSVHFGYQLTTGKNLILEDYVYINALSELGIRLGNNVTIARAAILSCTGVIANKGVGISIGNNSAVGAQSFLGGQGGLIIGNDVIMGPHVKIFSENHNFSAPDVLIRKQGESRKGVTIGNNCWIGAGVTILDGVTIADGCIIAAGSVVTQSFPINSLIAGIPAKVLKSRV